MEHIETYRDHRINAWTDEGQDGDWVWTFTIDDEHITWSHDGMLTEGSSESAALQQAVAEARRRVDEWPRG